MNEPLYPRIVAGVEPNQRGEDALALAVMLAETAGGELEPVHVEQGPPEKRFFALADRGEADLIVLGSTHRAAIGRVTPGSVAEHLLNGARCRLAIAPHGYAEARQGGEIRTEPRVIGAGFNGAPDSRAALAEAAELASRAGASMRVIAVEPPLPRQLGPGAAAPTPPPQPRQDLQTPLHDAVAELPGELRALPVFERGDPAEVLLREAEVGMDLLVLGSRGFGPVLRLLVGSVAGVVIREAPCPVLVTPRRG
jgi:nucleotide-binding universal stress UspA family protein